MKNPLATLDKARMLLEKATKIDEVKEIRDKAEALRMYAKEQRMGLEAQNYCAEIKIRAERRAGELLKKIPKESGKRTDLTSSHDDTRLQDLGISRPQSSRWQQMAALPKKEFEQHVEETKAASQELTTASTLRKAKQYIGQQKPDAAPLPKGKYRIFYADPPWDYGNSGLPEYGHAKTHYPSMTIPELCSLPIEDMAGNDAVLFLWVTSPLLEDSFRVIKAWGFKYKTSFVWDKVKHNFGYYNSVRHEFLLVCTRGSCTPDNKKLFDSVQSIERDKTHSQKPNEFRKIIETIYDKGKKIELFARDQIAGWKAWGNEA